MTQQPLSNSEIRDLCYEIAEILQKNVVSDQEIIDAIERKLAKYILIPKYKTNEQS